MKIYKKKHTSKKALDIHIEKIANRGGQWKENGLELEYRFPLEELMKKYDSEKKQILVLKKKGNIITFKYPFPSGNDGLKKQILVTGFKTDRKTGAVKIIGRAYDSKWYKNINQMIDAVNWYWMAKNID